MINGHMIHALVCLEQTNELSELKACALIMLPRNVFILYPFIGC